MKLEELNRQIPSINKEAAKKAKNHWNGIAHPLHSLGKLEDYVVWLAGIYGDANVKKPKKALVVMCGDNGVVEEGVTQTGQEVTAIVAENFLTGKATAAILCKETGADIFPIDIGMASDTKAPSRKVAYGTKNMAKQQAMTREEAVKAIETGIALVKEIKEKGYGLIATGEMGIGNTTTSSAVVSVLLNKPPREVTGRGAGLDRKALERKIHVVENAISKHNPKREDAVDVLSKVGGFDICGMTGIFLGGALYQVPVVIDGFISSSAALCAARIAPASRAYMAASHVSKEPAASMVLDALKLEAPLHCDMSLGEGTGAVSLFPLIDMGISVYQSMSTFVENDIPQYKEFKT